MNGIRKAHALIDAGKLPLLERMTAPDERFAPSRMIEAIERASDSDSLKVIVDWEME